ncbi:hypothetical protein GV51_0276 [Gardnerella vaginalis 5-1]|nr:hypothetical protein GV51_0276 [Gardnerella vaginalis 5-1]
MYKKSYIQCTKTTFSGQKIMQWADNLWAIPLSALWDREAFE